MIDLLVALAFAIFAFLPGALIFTWMIRHTAEKYVDPPCNRPLPPVGSLWRNKITGEIYQINRYAENGAVVISSSTSKLIQELDLAALEIGADRVG